MTWSELFVDDAPFGQHMTTSLTFVVSTRQVFVVWRSLTLVHSATMNMLAGAQWGMRNGMTPINHPTRGFLSSGIPEWFIPCLIPYRFRSKYWLWLRNRLSALGERGSEGPHCHAAARVVTALFHPNHQPPPKKKKEKEKNKQ